MQHDEVASFLDPDTGKVETVSRDLLREAEEGDEDEAPDLPAWQEPEWEIARQIVSSGRFLKLPTKFEVNDWEIMREFASSVESDRVREDLERAIHGSGAFRYFKETIRRHRIEQDWFTFRDAALRKIAIDWCRANQVAWK